MPNLEVQASSLEDAMNVCRVETVNQLVKVIMELMNDDEAEFEQKLKEILKSEFGWWIPKGLRCCGVVRE
jgi:hypothetical protein